MRTQGTQLTLESLRLVEKAESLRGVKHMKFPSKLVGLGNFKPSPFSKKLVYED